MRISDWSSDVCSSDLSYYPSGPLIGYAPDRVSNPPTSAEELLAWAKENPNKFIYARPANSGPGRPLLMGLPYLLGDSAPKDPMRSEARRVGEACVSPCSYRWSPAHKKKKTNKT